MVRSPLSEGKFGPFPVPDNQGEMEAHGELPHVCSPHPYCPNLTESFFLAKAIFFLPQTPFISIHPATREGKVAEGDTMNFPVDPETPALSRLFGLNIWIQGS